MFCKQIFYALFLGLISFHAFVEGMPKKNYSSSSSSSSSSAQGGQVEENSSALQRMAEAGGLDQSLPEIADFGEILDFTSNADIKEMNSVFETAPQDAKNIVRHLKDPNFYRYRAYRTAILVGRPGAVKSTLAKAIAYKMSKEKYEGKAWEHRFVVPRCFEKDTRGGTTMRLDDFFKSIKARGRPFIFILDEFNLLCEDSENSHFDTKSISAALWTFIDAMKGNPKFFFIGTTNRINMLPQQLKSRILARCIEFNGITSEEARADFFFSILDEEESAISSNEKKEEASLENDVKDISSNDNVAPKVQLIDVNKEYVQGKLALLKNCSQRDVKEFSFAARKAFRRRDTESKIIAISKADIDEAMNDYKHIYDVCEYNNILEPIEERRLKAEEQRHKESIAQNDLHFVQNHLIAIKSQLSQVTSSRNGSLGVAGGISGAMKVPLMGNGQLNAQGGFTTTSNVFPPEAMAAIGAVFTEPQMRIANELMEKSEKAEKEKIEEMQRLNAERPFSLSTGVAVVQERLRKGMGLPATSATFADLKPSNHKNDEQKDNILEAPMHNSLPLEKESSTAKSSELDHLIASLSLEEEKACSKEDKEMLESILIMSNQISKGKPIDGIRPEKERGRIGGYLLAMKLEKERKERDIEQRIRLEDLGREKAKLEKVEGSRAMSPEEVKQLEEIRKEEMRLADNLKGCLVQ